MKKELFRKFIQPLTTNRLVFQETPGEAAGETVEVSPEMLREAEALLDEFTKNVPDAVNYERGENEATAAKRAALKFLETKGVNPPDSDVIDRGSFSWEGYYANTVLLQKHGTGDAKEIRAAVERIKGGETAPEPEVHALKDSLAAADAARDSISASEQTWMGNMYDKATGGTEETEAAKAALEQNITKAAEQTVKDWQEKVFNQSEDKRDAAERKLVKSYVHHELLNENENYDYLKKFENFETSMLNIVMERVIKNIIPKQLHLKYSNIIKKTTEEAFKKV